MVRFEEDSLTKYPSREKFVLMSDFQKLFVAIDFSPGSDEALRQAHNRALSTGAQLAVCHIIPNELRSNLLFPHISRIAALKFTLDMRKIAEAAVAKYAQEGFDIHYIHRSDRTGFKAGALANGLKTAKSELLAIFDADFVPKPDCLRKLVDFFTDPLVACAQMRWAHINGNYNLLTRLQTIMLDGHFVVEQTTRNRAGGFFNFNGTAGIWRRAAIAEAGGWSSSTLTEDLDLSYRAQLAGWRFVFCPDIEVPADDSAR